MFNSICDVIGLSLGQRVENLPALRDVLRSLSFKACPIHGNDGNDFCIVLNINPMTETKELVLVVIDNDTNRDNQPTGSGEVVALERYRFDGAAEEDQARRVAFTALLSIIACDAGID